MKEIRYFAAIVLLVSSCRLALADGFDDARSNLREIQFALNNVAFEGKDAATVAAIQKALQTVTEQVAALKPLPSPSPTKKGE